VIVYHTGVFREGVRVPDMFGKRESNIMLTYIEIHKDSFSTKKWFLRMWNSRRRRK